MSIPLAERRRFLRVAALAVGGTVLSACDLGEPVTPTPQPATKPNSQPARILPQPSPTTNLATDCIHDSQGRATGDCTNRALTSNDPKWKQYCPSKASPQGGGIGAEPGTTTGVCTYDAKGNLVR